MHGGDFILEVGGGDRASHMMEHELGGMFDVAHGAGFATIWGIRAMEEYDRDRTMQFQDRVIAENGTCQDDHHLYRE